ncbi:MAG TPA: AarF/UbiB family protein [Chitinophagales bacterium]|nr:AarF/UbiB family protein [Chitinophagales bacterium]HMZ34298.1 AarF/UbiB family protein [Chitinophagales bacterium]
MMEEQEKIPTSKVARASSVFRTSMRVGANYLKHNAQKMVHKEVNEDALNEKNASELFNLMSQLKGSALKIAQMLSMDNGLLPKGYAEKFALAQNSAMALSSPLVMNTFMKYMNQSPYDLYDSFEIKANHAASIGQVHLAYKNGNKLAVKLQYPGVADSIHADIQMVKPLLLRIVGIKEIEVKQYFDEFEERLIDECNYQLELSNGVEIAAATKHIPNLIIPTYYPALSSSKVLTMEWIDAQPMQVFLDTETNQANKDKIGQALLDFLHTSIHDLKKFHADPHPGNFLVTKDMQLVVLDFGCVKSIPNDFYNYYFSLVRNDVLADTDKLRICLKGLDMLRDSDTAATDQLFMETSLKAIQCLSKPMKSDTFYFGDLAYYEQLQLQGEEFMNNKALRTPEAMRGSRHAIYLHRTFFGLYSILHKLNATVRIDRRFIENVGV